MDKQDRFLLIIDGPMGGGKSTVADLLKTKLDSVLFTGIDRLKWSISGFDRSSEGNRLVARLVESLARTALTDGMSVCVEQGFMKAEYMFPFINLAKEIGVRLFVYQIEAPRDILIERLKPRKTPVDAKSPVSMEKIEKNLDNYFNNKYSQAKVIDSGKYSPDEISQFILKDITGA